ncbi:MULTISPECIES: DEAD/DEAH box helicase [unclassified Fibrobacter]|uniref:DEAD/DEAH box helicase n=1 Tax=unclassified Fibrobacter TaxID=2634177 RepID=UPI000D7B565A|nr:MULTISPECIES: DEAD/DEAH box helicase [unclassified Fibrobacter]PWJ68136.1 ATP-dependent RNA helicase RhlE [Fibrobacter sp. UWR4]PZW71871.1 ATP-dependent RNA helicase RhlE [Fibrobacter sp. UWR1]
MKFEELPLANPLQRAVRTVGYEQPTPIQEQSIPSLLEGKDLLGIAQTGTGKTAAFALPILQRLLDSGKFRQPKTCRALILLPTRELAIQVEECFKQYAQYTAISTACIFGGVSDVKQKNVLIRGVDVLVATPGRLLDLVGQKAVTMKNVEFFVLDEADRMLDMGFIHDIRKVVGMLPGKRQNLFFSATMPKEISDLAATILSANPVRVEVAPQSTPIERIRQELYRIDKRRKGALLKELLSSHEEMKKVLVFCRTKHGADKIVRVLEKAGIKCAAIHGNKSQNRRQEALGNFKTEQIRVLVATDIAARGIDVDDVTHVFNYDLPNEPETFVHRIGRTARAGKEGVAISFCSPDEEQDLRGIEKLTRVKIPEGDKSIYERLPEQQKETPESELRNARGRIPRGQKGDRRNDPRHSGGSEATDRIQGQQTAKFDWRKHQADKRNARAAEQARENQRHSDAGQNPQQLSREERRGNRAEKFGRRPDRRNDNRPNGQQGGRPNRHPEGSQGQQFNQNAAADGDNLNRRTIGRNRPGSRARKRMREAAAASAAASAAAQAARGGK